MADVPDPLATAADPTPTIPDESAEDLYHRAPCGYLSTLPDGTIVRVNDTLVGWTGLTDGELVGRRFVDLLGAGGRIFHETHFAPLLLMQGEVREIAFDLICAGGRVMPVLVNSLLVPGDDGLPLVIRTTIYDSTVRHEYEQELLRARRRAEESERQVRETAEMLQRSLMQGGLAGGPGFSVGTVYRPAVQALEIGGDWHDAFWLPGRDTIAVSVGDVVGRGIGAACAMGQLRSAIRAIAISRPGPGALFDQLDAFVEQVTDARFATVAYAELDLGSHELRYACAGHLPPLVIGPDGSSELLWGGRSLPLATLASDIERSEATVTLTPGSRLLLYTDGLIERRTRDLDVGLDQLTSVAASLRNLAVVEYVDALTESLLADEDTRDDVCVLCLDYEGPAPSIAASTTPNPPP